MEKQDLLYGILALGLIIVIALVIKPLATGESIDLGLPVSTTEPTPVPDDSTPEITSVVTEPVPVTITLTPVPTPTPSPTWDLSETSIVFVDPATYGLNLNQTLPGGTRFDSSLENNTMVVYSTIDGQYSGTTDIFSMPFPYWEIWYSVEPAGAMMGKDQSLSTSTVEGPKESGIKSSGGTFTVIEGSFSVVNPQFNLQVMDGSDPNRIVRTITPPGGLDMSLWVEQTDEEGNIISTDPRPWIEKFFEGQRTYYFVINTQSLESYTIEIRVPARYVGMY